MSTRKLELDGLYPRKCPDCFKQYSVSLLFPSNAQKEEYYLEYFKTISIFPKKKQK